MQGELMAICYDWEDHISCRFWDVADTHLDIMGA